MRIEDGFVRVLRALRHTRSEDQSAASSERLHEIYQVSTINAVLEGIYDGEMSFAQLKAHGDFGIGTLNALDGEMIGFDGNFWQVTSDGRAQPIPNDACTPIATVIFFTPQIERRGLGPLDFDALKALIDTLIPSRNLFCAVRLDGTFATVRTRSVPRQSKPYPPLVEVTEHQPEFAFTDVAGTLAGFRFPDFASGVNVPGYHLHFLTADRTGGGHVLDLELTKGDLAIDTESDLHIELPHDREFLATDLSGDHSADIKKAEE